MLWDQRWPGCSKVPHQLRAGGDVGILRASATAGTGPIFRNVGCTPRSVVDGQVPAWTAAAWTYSCLRPPSGTPSWTGTVTGCPHTQAAY